MVAQTLAVPGTSTLGTARVLAFLCCPWYVHVGDKAEYGSHTPAGLHAGLWGCMLQGCFFAFAS